MNEVSVYPIQVLRTKERIHVETQNNILCGNQPITTLGENRSICVYDL